MRHLLRPLALLAALCFPAALPAQEKPYFVTYSHDLEEPGNLEIKFLNTAAQPEVGNRFIATVLELEYGVNGWWTTEFYLDGQSTHSESTVFTGFKWENRFRPLMREHWINPVLYVEYEHIREADKTLREVVGHDGKDFFAEHNHHTHAEHEKELELKLILSSNVKGWNISENFISEKNLVAGPWEFGYAVAASRPLRLAASAKPCTFCPEKWAAGVEMFGGLGDTESLTLRDTSHYLGPTIRWDAPNGMSFAFSPQFGLTSHSLPRLYRFSVSYEIDQIFSRLGFRGRSANASAQGGSR